MTSRLVTQVPEFLRPASHFSAEWKVVRVLSGGGGGGGGGEKERKKKKKKDGRTKSKLVKLLVGIKSWILPWHTTVPRVAQEIK